MASESPVASAKSEVVKADKAKDAGSTPPSAKSAAVKSDVAQSGSTKPAAAKPTAKPAAAKPKAAQLASVKPSVIAEEKAKKPSPTDEEGTKPAAQPKGNGGSGKPPGKH